MEGWGSYFALIGTAAATLLGLMFVAVSITASYMTEELAPGLRVFLSPTIFHLAGVLVLCLLVTVPVPVRALGITLAVVGLLGVAYAFWVLVHIRRYRFDIELDDRIFYGVGSLPCYLLTVAAGLLLVTHARVAPYLLAASVMLLILVCVRNAWDITVWAVIRAPNR